LGADPIFAFFGGLEATAAIYGLAQVGRKTPVTALLLAGGAGQPNIAGFAVGGDIREQFTFRREGWRGP